MRFSQTLTYSILILLPIYHGCQSQTEPPQKPINSAETNSTENTSPKSMPATTSSVKVIENTAQKWVLEIRDPDGIGQAKVSTPNQGLPEKIILNVYLRGLESFRITTKQTTFSLQLQSHGDLAVLAEYDGKSLPVQDDQKLIAIMPGERKPTVIPLADGDYFQITLPASISIGPEMILEWVDFYR